MIELNKLVGDSIALIPVGGKSKIPKVEKWQGEPRLKIFELLDLMRHAGTSSVAMRCGSVSDGIVCLDIDSKKYVGIDAEILSGVRELYPSIWEKLRVEKTQSGGYHLLWRFAGQVGSKNLCYRLASKEELESEPRVKKICFVELKGEGSLSHCYPSPSYELEKEAGGEGVRLVKFLTSEEHGSLLNLVKSFNEYFEPEKKERITGSQDIYDESPFVHFNKSAEGEGVLEGLGWVCFKSNRKAYYKKPGRVKNEVDATFDFTTRMYSIWSTQTGFETGNHSPSMLLGMSLGYDGKGMFAYLVAKGFGRIKAEVERRIIERVARKKNGILPSNVSQEGLVLYETEKKKVLEKYPYGIFWKYSEELTFKISRDAFLRVANEMGFRRLKHETCFIDDYVVRFVDSDFFFESMKAYIKEDSDELMDVYEQFLQTSGEWTKKRFRELDLSVMLRSTAIVSYKFFKNCYVEVTRDGEEILSYEGLQNLIFEDKIKNREYVKKKDYAIKDGIRYKSLYYDFLMNAIEGGVNDYLMQCIGYYAHEFRDERGFMFIATESCEDSGSGGSAGKNVFWSLLGSTTTFKSIAADQVKFDNNLLQSWDKQRILSIADIPKKYNLSFFKNLITEGAVVNKKFINEYEIAVEDMPKLGGSSNFTFDVSADGGLARRIKYIEFTDFFKRTRGVDSYYKKMFPKDWEDYEYVWFDNFINDCISVFLRCDYKIGDSKISKTGWIKAFKTTYTYLYEFFGDNMERWRGREVTDDVFKAEFDKFIIYGNLSRGVYTMTKVNKALEEYCEHFEIPYENGVSIRVGAGVERGRRFVVEVEVEEPPF